MRGNQPLTPIPKAIGLRRRWRFATQPLELDVDYPGQASLQAEKTDGSK
jgi:hypothetical protein